MGDQVIKIIVKSASKGDEKVYIRHFIGSNTYFEDFKKKIVTRFPYLREKDYKLYWIDGDSDQITIFYEEDFRIFIENNETSKNRIYVEERSEKYVNFIPTTEPAAKPTSSADACAGAPRMEIHPKHKNITCDACGLEIVGMRYKCLECKDYDLCMECEQKLIHHDHAMLRFYIPAEFIDWSNVRFDKFVRKFKHHGKHPEIPSKIEISVENENESPKENGNQEKCEYRKHLKRGGRHHKGGQQSFWLNMMKYMNDLANQDNPVPQSPRKTTTTPTSNEEAAQTLPTGLTQPPPNRSVPPTFGGPVPPPRLGPHQSPFGLYGPPPPPFGEHNTPQFRTYCQTPQFVSPIPLPFQPKVHVSFPQFSPQTNQQKPTKTAQNANTNKIDETDEQPTHEDFNLASLINLITKTSLGIEVIPSADKSKETVPQTENVTEATPDKTNEMAIGKSSSSATDTSGQSESESVKNIPKHVAPVVDEPVKQTEVTTTQTEVLESFKAPRSVESTPDPDEKEWDVIDEEIVLEKLEQRRGSPATGAIPKEQIVTLKNMSTNTSANDIPTLISFEESNAQKQNTTNVVSSSQTGGNDNPKEEMPDYAKLGRDLQRHIQEQMAALKDNEKEIYHSKEHINSAVITMMAMGFSNEGGWLTQLLDSVDGNISKALDLLQPNK